MSLLVKSISLILVNILMTLIVYSYCSWAI